MIIIGARKSLPRTTIALGLLALLAMPPHAAASERAEQFIRQRADEVIEILSDRSASAQDKRSDIWQVIDRSINSEQMARATLGDYAAGKEQSQIDRYVRAFRRYLRMRYAGEIARMSTLEVEITGSDEMRNERGTRVISRVSVDGSRASEVDWRVVDDEIIADVQIGGVWLVSDLRSQLAPVLDQNGGRLGAAIDFLDRRRGEND